MNSSTMIAKPDGKLRIVLAGGSGFLGTILARHFLDNGWEVVVLTRGASRETSVSERGCLSRGGSEMPGALEGSGPVPHVESPAAGTAALRPQKVFWDGKTVGSWQESLEGAEALVNLSGRSIDCRHTATNRTEILESRINSTRLLGEAVSQCGSPPKVWLNCSGADIYPESFDHDFDDRAEGASPSERSAARPFRAKSDSPKNHADKAVRALIAKRSSFSSEVARLWENAFEEARAPATRKIALRISMVLGAKPGTAFPVFRRLARAGLAGRMGNGKQYVSWIHETDFCRVVEWLIGKPELSGPINVTAPTPVTNEEFMRRLRQAVGRRFGLPATSWMLALGAFFMRTETELILKSRRVAPGRLLASGFEFSFPELGSAFQELERRIAGVKSVNWVK